MIDLALDPLTTDLVLADDGDLALRSGFEERAQYIKTVLQTWQGEWFADVNLGVDWLDLLPRKPEARALVTARVVATVTAIRGVAEVIEVGGDFDGTNRRFGLDLRIRLDTGEIVDVGV